MGWIHSDYNACLSSRWTADELPTGTELGNIIASHSIYCRLAGGKLIELVWMNNSSIPNVRFIGTLEMAQINLPGVGGVVGWSHIVYNANLSLNWT